jgi:hypothetical protein
MKKVKRYEGGGEIEEAAAKQRGLDISNKEEPMGFFERIRAGNIDDPSSEAYKRFGAGRDRPSPVPRIPPKPRMPTPNEESGKMQNLISAGSDFSSRNQDEGYRPNAGTAMERAMAEGAYDSGKITENTGPRTKPLVTTAAKPVTSAKAPQVTKAELEKSGLSLRDYMNKQQGLTRKESAKAAVSDAEALETKRGARYTPPGSAPKQSMGRQRQPFMPGDVDNSFPGAKFKGGGKVRSASARADGIAIRGKTRA